MFVIFIISDINIIFQSEAAYKHSSGFYMNIGITQIPRCMFMPARVQ